jgi:TatD DNase family protein
MLVDTHCHIHETNYSLDPTEVLVRAHQVGVDKIICVGTDEQSSNQALNFANQHEEVFASVGVHPHDSKNSWSNITNLLKNKLNKLVAVGEIGLDYVYIHSSKDLQIMALEAQIQLAIDYNLPIIFHIRDAFDDFWPIFDNFHGLRGVLHSFSDSWANTEKGLARGLYIGVNGISTFTKNETQKAIFTRIPLNSLLLETDAPFLTPAPYRGTINEPVFVGVIAEHQAKLRDVPLDVIAKSTTTNAHALFAL